ncbi:meiosis initiator protein isoform X2 [Colius striatus]|uniref:meiosis initiator protein isoform X2 n=1 Tax=Colius striatus TaxID=57412 RepID=UPI002B1D422B|nr:meiosis initiator protein isoform X2 [Colius striatus]
MPFRRGTRPWPGAPRGPGAAVTRPRRAGPPPGPALPPARGLPAGRSRPCRCLTLAFNPPQMWQPRDRTGSAEPPLSRRPPRRDWRSLLLDLERMVPWPRDGGAPHTEIQILANVLGYILYLQKTLSITQLMSGQSGDSDTAEERQSTRATCRQRLVFYKEEEGEVKGTGDPWLCPTKLYWETVGWDEVVPLSPTPRQKGLLGLSPSLLASPTPPGPPEGVIRGEFGGAGEVTSVCLSVCLSAQCRCPPDLFPDVYLGTQAPAVAQQEPVASGSRVTPRPVPAGTGKRRRRRGEAGSPCPKKKCVNGFIMFCRLNRRPYMSTHPGLTSIAATCELAQLWRSLSPEEQRPYCLQARRFSRQQDRVVRLDKDRDGDGDTDPPLPSWLLLAARAAELRHHSLKP